MTADQLRPHEAPKRRTLHTIVVDMLGAIEDAGGEVTAAVDDLGLELDDKVQAYCAVMRQLAAESKMLEELAHEYKLRAAARENQVTALKFRLDATMQAVGLDKIKTPTATVFYASTKSVLVENESAFLDRAEDRFVVVKQSVNRTAVKEALEAGEQVEGAELKASRHLRFR